MKNNASFWSEYKAGIILTLAVLIAGTSYYFATGVDDRMSAIDPALFEEMRLKVAIADGTALKLFALAPEQEVARLPAAQGQPMVAEGVVIGSDEAAMMMEEALFARPGDRLEGFFGIDATVTGVLEKTGTIADDMHFLGAEQYGQLQGEERAFVKLSPEGMPKLFYTLGEGEALPAPASFAEGSAQEYKTREIAGVAYYPVVIGAKEAAMMREEKLFERPGDTIRGFFGRDVFIAGVLEETNTSLDMMHIVPLWKDDLA